MKKSSKPALAALLESFFRQYLAAQKRVSSATMSTYRDSLRLLLVFVSQKIGKRPSSLTVQDLDRDIILEFLDYLEEERGNSIRTRNLRLAAIRSFFHHIAYQDPALLGVVHRVLDIPGKKTTRKSVNYLHNDELEVILNIPDRSTIQGRRDYALLLFLSRTGARVSEAVGLNAIDIRLNRPYQVLIHGKGSKDRVIPLLEDATVTLREFCQEMGLASDEERPVFVNANGKRLTRFGVIHILRRTVNAASKEMPDLTKRSISPHTLRHTIAMQLLKAGVDLTTIQSWLGHAHPDTTHHYVEADVEMKRRAIEICDTPESKFIPYQPTDDVLAFLESL